MTTLLIDAHASIYRAYYSTGNLSTKGNPTGVPFGFFWSILSLAEQFHTNRFIFCWDSKASRRKDIFPSYKLSRHEDLTEEEQLERKEIHAQIDVLRKEILPSVGFNNNLHHDGFEADDIIAQVVIGTPATQFVGVSGDHDLFQLLRFKNFRMYSPGANKLWTASSFTMEFGVAARDWVLVKSIAGCPTDGVPGVPGVAIKTAIQYTNGSLKVGKKYKAIAGNFPLFKRNYRLVSLPFLNTPSDAMKDDWLSANKLFDFFGDCDFQSFLTPEMKKRWVNFVTGAWR